jgi:hypothetical protein
MYASPSAFAARAGDGERATRVAAVSDDATTVRLPAIIIARGPEAFFGSSADSGARAGLSARRREWRGDAR